MAEPIILLAKALNAELDTRLSITIERRYAPYFDADQLVNAKWVMLKATDETSNERRGLADNELGIDIAIQQALPDLADRDDDYIDTDWCDARIEDLGTVKALFRPGGALRDVRLADCDFRRYINAPIYRPDMLLEHGIFTAVLRLVYMHELNDDDD